ncbi:response regulator [Clostridium sp. SHJSY1]|nr:response regulator [Clostridium sp. SHJSY1]
MMKRVLIVDDAAFMRFVLRQTLEKCGFEVVGEAENGVKAIRLFRQLKPDVVTMDLTMPALSGVDSIKVIKLIDEEAKIIVISSSGQKLAVEEAIEAGATSFLVKPFKEKVLAERLVDAFKPENMNLNCN